MKKIKQFIIIVISLVLVSILFFFRNLKPIYNGKLGLHGAKDNVSVYFDTFGVPHIYAKNTEDAYRALGYVHAQDRLFQMELLRRIAPGELSEIFGDATLEVDRLFITLGINESSKKAVDSLDKNSQAYLFSNAYINGINQFINDGSTPIEFHLLGIKKKKFTLVDMLNIAGYMGYSFMQADKTDPLLTVLYENLGPDYISELPIEVDSTYQLIPSFKNKSHTLLNLWNASSQKRSKALPFPPLKGSNSWVLGPSKTLNKKVIFANDPHIEYAQPSVWYEAHINTPTYEMYGYHIAGFAFPFLGHNRNYAYGLTMLTNDDTNFYWETIHPNDTTKYKIPQGWDSFEYIEKAIKVKNKEDITLQVRKTRHGPIINNLFPNTFDKRPIAMSWIYTKFPSKIIESCYHISHARDINDFKYGCSLVHAPGLNIMYGDNKNNIAWWASGKLYWMNKGVERKFLLNGASGTDDPVKYLDFSENPYSVNPPCDYVYSANNPPDSIEGKIYPGYYAMSDRADRIVALIENEENWTLEKSLSMITDVTSQTIPDYLKILNEEIKQEALSDIESKAFDLLINWDGSFDKNYVAPTLYNQFVYRFMRETFKDKMGEENFTLFFNTKLSDRSIGHFLNKSKSIWWEYKGVQKNKSSIITTAFKESISDLKQHLGNDVEKWQWKNVANLTHKHPLHLIPIIGNWLNVGPFSVDGSKGVINVKGFTYDNKVEYPIESGPSTRRIIDFSNVAQSKSILPTGQSGNRISPFYKNQAKMYVNNEFRTLWLDQKDILDNLYGTLEFNPVK